MIYLDYNATTPIDPRVVDAMIPYLREIHGNPYSPHAAGREVRAAVVRARSQVAAMLNAALPPRSCPSKSSPTPTKAFAGCTISSTNT